MKFVADESVDRQIVEHLREAGHTVLYVAEAEPGIHDEAVLGLARREKALLLTADKDFGELVFRQRRLASGIILIRLAGLPPDRKANIVLMVVEKHGHNLPNCFTVISPEMVRFRQLEKKD
ncbi:hypothetical protein Adeg_0279 [Ammonifex degensii KC4]|uniref:DUF5615 domain-containing protein n=1 Tax=Ammonifex degensii (strain DSM 10501 / KC4) TaxID=429009 RepID=C9RB16_AMMDK|nr:DUF5615 family PIN-like protein [Ammonifex degensii]ACX51443.1 hypothetical protein Adeg_0279 [Ammonifex degensii KC4]